VRPAPSPCKTLTARNAQQRNAGLINGGRQRRIKRNKRETIQTETWNILKMLKPGRLQEIAEQDSKYYITDSGSAGDKMEGLRP
jgi:hypothetical protein